MTQPAGFMLSPNVIKEATTFNPFKMNLDADTAEFNEDVYFLGANSKQIKEQTVVELHFKCMEHSPLHANVKFHADLWLDDDICAGRVRPSDADEQRWRGTKAALRTLTNLARTFGIKTDNPIDALTDPALPAGQTANITIRVYRANNGQHKWDINRVKAVSIK